MKKRPLIIFVLLVFVVMCIGGCSAARETLRFGTGSPDGVYFAYGSALAEAIEKDTGGIVEVLNTTGSEGNLRLLGTDVVDMALAQSDTLEIATSEQEPDEAPSEEYNFRSAFGEVSAVAGVYTEACQIIASESSGIATIEDLAGKRVSIGEEESGVTRNAEQILMAYGMSTDAVIPSRLSLSESITALERGEIDAFFWTGSAPTQAIIDLAKRMPVRFLQMDERSRQQLTGLYGWYVPYTIPARTYEGQNEEVHTCGVRAILIVNNSLGNNTVKAITAAVYENPDLLHERVPAEENATLTPELGIEGVPIGFHPGAAEYYEEHGVEVTVAAEAEAAGFLVVPIDMYQTLAIAVGILFLGGFLKKRIKFLETFCIPSPVVGGLIFAVAACVLYVTGVLEMQFDETLRNVCMVIFFTSVGFQANLKVLKSGGKDLVVFLGLVIALILIQNGGALWVSSMLHIDPMVGMCTGSIPMIGGHGTAGAFGPVLEGLGLPGATTLTTAAATFGLVAGSLMGGPVGRRLIMKNNLLDTADQVDTTALVEDEVKHHRHARGYAPAAYQIAIAMGIGTVVSWALSLTGMSFPIYIGSMIVAAIMRNWSEISGKFEVPMGEINDIGGICLSLFLGIAMITLKLWQLADLALPLIVLLLVQVGVMFIFSYFIVYNAMGRNYDAAVLAAGTCGFGMGATPNAMANMQALTDQFLPSVKAYILVPIVGSMFADFLNSIAITFFINTL